MEKKQTTDRYTLADLENWSAVAGELEPPIRTEFSIDLRDLRVMIIGAGGGTGRAIAWQCALESCERLVLVNRTLEKANALAEQLRPFFSDARVLGPATRLEAVALDESAMRVQLADIDLIVNATPLGMNPSDPTPVPAPFP